MVFGIGALVVALAGVVAWVAKSAHSRGRSVIAWVAIGVVAGGLGLQVGRAIYRNATAGDNLNDAALMAGLLAVPLSAFAALILVIVVLTRLPVHVGRAREWPVHVMKRGPGSVRIAGDALHVTWHDMERVLPAAELRDVEVDGQCVRFVTTSDDVFVLMPRGGPDSSEYRAAQSKALARAISAVRGPRP